MRLWWDAGRPCGEVISGMGERVSRGRENRAQRVQCITFRECFGEKAHVGESNRDSSLSAVGRN